MGRSVRVPWTTGVTVAALVVALSGFVVPTASAAQPAARTDCAPSGDPGGPIGADTVLARAAAWVQHHVPSSGACAAGPGAASGRYREDAAGFVSMAWALDRSLTTSAFDPETDGGDARFQPISRGELVPGDALVADSGSVHDIVLFTGWSSRDGGRRRFANLDFDESAGGEPGLSGTVSIADRDLDGPYWEQFSPIHYADMRPGPWPVGVGGSALRGPALHDRNRVFWTGPDGRLRQSYSVTEYAVWRTQDLGGDLTGAPAVTHLGAGNDGRFDVFAVSPGGHLFQKTYRHRRWGGWHEIAPGTTWEPGVAAVVVTTGATAQFHVFGHDPAGHLLQAYWSRHRWHVQDLGGRTTGTPAATYHDGQYDVFAASPGGNLYQRTYSVFSDPSAESGDLNSWTPWQRDAVGFASGTGVAALWTGDRLRVIGLDHDGRMVQGYQSGAAWAVQDLGGRFVRPLGATYYDGGRMRAYGRTAGGVFYSAYRPGLGWSRWIRIAPAA